MNYNQKKSFKKLKNVFFVERTITSFGWSELENAFSFEGHKTSLAFNREFTDEEFDFFCETNKNKAVVFGVFITLNEKLLYNIFIGNKVRCSDGLGETCVMEHNNYTYFPGKKIIVLPEQLDTFINNLETHFNWYETYFMSKEDIVNKIQSLP